MKKLHMIGNSHIDPVWFWVKREGLQAVKSTFASALDRMNEYPDFKFTASSACFYKWIEEICPTMFEEIKIRIKEGRWSYVGGFFIEPDCNMPSGESFARQALYSQRYFKKAFGEICKIGFCVDSFGHNNNLPQLLKNSGMDYYIYMRPDTKNMPKIFNWISPDGSSVIASKIQGEYTTWFSENLKENLRLCSEGIESEDDEYHCFFGVGNHGGGPTIENIENLLVLKDELKENVSIEFSTLNNFFANLENKKTDLPKFTGEIQKCNEGCYSIMSNIKILNRKAENYALRAEKINFINKIFTGNTFCSVKDFEKIWESILFQQFHDILTGTSIIEAIEETKSELGRAISNSTDIETRAIQNIGNHFDTTGEGFPLFIFNPSGSVFNDYVEIEIEWFCKDELIIKDLNGNDIEYQRIRTSTPSIHLNLAGRRRFLFKAELPAFGFGIYKLYNTDKQILEVNHIPPAISDTGLILENDFVFFEIDEKSGMITKLIDKENNYNAIKTPGKYRIFEDKKDAWGGGNLPCEYLGDDFEIAEIKKVEDGNIRKVIRATYKYKNSKLTQLFILYKNRKYIEVKNILNWSEAEKRLKFTWNINSNAPIVRVETPYSSIERNSNDQDDCFMHRWVDFKDSVDKSGLLLVNDSKYAYCANNQTLDFVILRSTVYAQGTTKAEWRRENDTYRYTDMGEQEFTFALYPHGKEIKDSEAIRLSDNINMKYSYLHDSKHNGIKKLESKNIIDIEKENIILEVSKESEDEDGLIIRLREVDGESTNTKINLYSYKDFWLSFKPYEIKTIFINESTIKETNFIELQEEQL